MATVSPVQTPTSEGGVPRFLWEALATGDTINSLTIRSQYGLAASVQMTGTWGGATVVLQVSNDGSTWFTAKDVDNANVSATADAYFEISSSAAYMRPGISGGTGDDIDFVLVMRGA